MIENIKYINSLISYQIDDSRFIASWSGYKRQVNWNGKYTSLKKNGSTTNIEYNKQVNGSNNAKSKSKIYATKLHTISAGQPEFEALKTDINSIVCGLYVWIIQVFLFVTVLLSKSMLVSY